MNRRDFLSNTVTGLGALTGLAKGSQIQPSHENVKEVLVMFKCHLDVGFVDTQAAIIRKYFAEYLPASDRHSEKAACSR
ncbi:MAG: hypothetical protein M3Y72_11520 [Acidobacteriota bacterium]|nr:hypothetical protein [Acidobacteriota bacterium]